MSRATIGANQVNYLYNGLGQRVSKQGPTALVPTGTHLYTFDEAGHLIGEYDFTATPRVRQETVYLGDTPVAVLTQTVAGSPAVFTTAVNYVYTDHIDTPRVITQASDNRMRWRSDQADPFASAAPNQNPASIGVFNYNPRFPGQFYDVESNLHYNYFRDYDPRVGRYTQSDPIGLAGGINTYLYANANPLSYTDPLGLNPGVGCLAGAWAGPLGCGVGAGIGTAIMGGVALAAILSTPGDTTKPEQCTDKPCPPCKTVSGKIVPVGTIGYRPMDTPSRPQHGITGSHFNIYKANQNPNNCQCFGRVRNFVCKAVFRNVIL